MAQPAPAMTWITELDGVDPTYNLTPFQLTVLGRLPTEVLELVAHFLDLRTLTAIARIDPKARALAELQLYRAISIPPKYDYDFEDGSDSDNPHDDGGHSGRLTRLLYRTLSERPDLAERVKKVDVDIQGWHIDIEVPSSTLLPGGSPFAADLMVSVLDAKIACALFQQLQNVEALCIRTVEHYEDMLFPELYANTAGLTPARGLQKVKSLEWHCPIFKWSVVEMFPKLTSLHLSSQSCSIMTDDTRGESGHNLRELRYRADSSIFNAGAESSHRLSSLVAHLTSLETLRLDINDHRARHGLYLRPGMEGSAAVLLAKLGPVTSTLKELSINSMAEHARGSPRWQLHLLSYTFKQFSALENLDVPYTFLFSPWPRDPRTPVPLTLERLLPLSLQKLCVQNPNLLLLDVLNQFPDYRDKLPALKSVQITCSNAAGAKYNVFAFESHLHPVFATLRSMNIDLIMRCRKGHWDSEWDNYDIPALDLAAWQMTLGSTITGISIVPIQEPEDDFLDDLIQMHATKGRQKSRKSTNIPKKQTTGGHVNWAKSAWTARRRRNMVMSDITLQATANREFEEIEAGEDFARSEAARRERESRRGSVRRRPGEGQKPEVVFRETVLAEV